MIGTIRKHSGWLWILIAGLTIISFVWFMGSAPSRGRGGGGGGGGEFGTIYGRMVTQPDYVAARNEFAIFYFLHNNEWPDRAQNLTETDREREIYIRLLLTRKARALGVHVSDDDVATSASAMLNSLGRNGQAVPMDEFVQRVLTPEGLTADDFAAFIRSDLEIQQLVQIMGLSGYLVTPQEAALFYQRDHQEASAQIVFFSASNYLSDVVASPGVVGQFYTNYLAAYRLPDRVQVNYVSFDVSNFLAQSKAEWAATNLEDNVDAAFRQYGMSAFPEAKTEADAKAKIRETLIRQRALSDAKKQADAFATTLFAMDPPKAENLDAVAKQSGLVVRTTEPFSADYGPEEFSATSEFIKTAFQLNADVPVAGPIAGTDAIYVIALARQLPSEIPSFEQIRDRVTRDYEQRVATVYAQRAGTNFTVKLAIQMAMGKSFAAACTSAGLHAEALPPFSIGTDELPEIGSRAELGRLKQAVFTTPVGRTSPLVQTQDGGFIVYVQSLLPIDSARQAADMPHFLAQVRSQNVNDAFNEWLNSEANRELRNVPFFQKQAAAAH
jgi:parvulin-like peptidyl-prolyl isomerase